MSSLIDQARALDRSRRPMEAIAAYERALKAGEGDLDTYVDLAVLYLQCCELGFIHEYQISPAVSETSIQNAFSTLDRAEAIHGRTDEIRFWRLYFDFAALGGPSFSCVARELVEGGQTLTPYFYLKNTPEERDSGEGSRRLFEIVQDGSTERKRLILSYLTSNLPFSSPPL